MAGNGPAPQPTALKKLRGNPGKRKLNNAEPMPDRAIPECPDWLRAEARVEWGRVCKTLHDCGILTNVDRAALAGYCQAWARWREAEMKVEKEGQRLKNEFGVYYLNPSLKAAESALADVLKFSVQLGMTPSARTRIRTDKTPVKKTLAEELFAKVSE